MRKLLVPMDNSDNATRALDYAIRLAKGTGSTAVSYTHLTLPTN